MKLLKFLSLASFLILFACQKDQKSSLPFEDPMQNFPPDQRFRDLFNEVQYNRIFPDGKTFADCIPKFPTDTIMAHFEARKKEMNRRGLEAFVKEHFDLPTAYATNYQSDTSRSPAQHINELWTVLTREPNLGDVGSLIGLPKPYIVPGGRFREIYYWDSYFTMLGLQTANKSDMIENMLDNFAYLIDGMGFIPNGNRTYFISRSQPPFFAAMIELLAKEKGDEVYKKYLPQLQKEHNFWMDRQDEKDIGKAINKRSVGLKDGSNLNRYWDERDQPRAESFREDIVTARASKRSENRVYRDLRAACESGWDFSSRWFADDSTLTSIHTTDIIPVDLNALLYNLEKTLEKAYTLNGDNENANIYKQLADQRLDALQRYCWNAQSSFFEDYDFVADRKTGKLSLAGVYPLFFKMATPEQAQAVAAVIERDFLKPGGVVTTLNTTGQQWDAPNGWAPLQWMTIQGLRNYGFDELADTIKQRWVDLNVKVYKNTGKMVEKYNVIDMNLKAGGGEYALQDGFGWTNGVLLKLLSEK